jgi:poly(3-hydroxybutyrate) depolymerase
MLYRLAMRTMALSLYFFCILLCFYGDGIDSRVAAQEIGEETCDVGPDALTNMFGIPINRTCIDVPYNGDNDNDMTIMERCYYTFVPDSCATTDTKLPLVMDVHGWSGCPLYSAIYTGWLEKAIEECFVVIWPTGTVGTIGTTSCFNLPGFLRKQQATNNDNDDDISNNTDSDSDIDNNDVITTITTPPCCCYDEDEDEISIPGEEPNDSLFLRMAIESVIDSFANENGMATGVSIDTSRIYMAGHSNGCMASLTMAALHSDLVAAVCCHAGTLITPYPTEYNPVPTFMVHGMKDSTVAFNGATFLDFPPFGKIGYLSIPDIANYIADKNDCDDDIKEMDVSNGTSSIEGISYKRTNCTNNADVEIIALFESGHFPYLTQGIGNQSFDPTAQSTTIDTTSMAWEFCSSYSKQQEQDTQESETSVTNDTVTTDKNETEMENEKVQDPANIVTTSNTDSPSKAPKSRSNDVSGTLLAMVALGTIITINIAIA